MFGRFQRRCVAVVVPGLLLAAAIPLVRYRRSFEPRTYRIGIRDLASLAPAAAEGRVDSLAAAIADEAARRAGMRLQWVACPEGADEAFRAGSVDLWPMLADLPERRRWLHLTDPWLETAPGLLTKGPPPKDWHGAPVGYGLGPPALLAQALPGARLVYMPGEASAIQALCHDRVAGAVVLKQGLTPVLLHRPAGCASMRFQLSPLPGVRLRIAIGSTPDARRAADALRHRIGEMAVDGALSERFSRNAGFTNTESEFIYALLDAERRSRLLAWGTAASALTALGLLWMMQRMRQARQTADQASSAKSEFLANMSHEIRTPLHGIVGMADLLGRTALNASQREMLGVIQGSADALMGVVDDVLHFARIETGRFESREIEFDLPAAVDAVARVMAPEAEGKGLKFEVYLAPTVPRRAKADPVLLRQTLLKLLSNAVKFTEKGTVRLELVPGGDPAAPLAVLFRIMDTGPGIDPDLVERLFTPFTQGQSGANRRFGGTGLGLAICRRLVQLMGGSMGVDSRPGAGSTFWILLPLKPAAEVHEDPAAVVPDPVHASGESTRAAPRGKLLIVDDNPVNQLVAMRAITTLGYEGQVVSGGREAIEALARGHFDLILMDCQMPDMDGYAATIEIRRLEARGGRGRAHLPIVAMTANSVEGDCHRCLAAGMDDYLPKPLRMQMLAEMLNRWIPSGATPAAR